MSECWYHLRIYTLLYHRCEHILFHDTPTNNNRWWIENMDERNKANHNVVHPIGNKFLYVLIPMVVRIKNCLSIRIDWSNFFCFSNKCPRRAVHFIATSTLTITKKSTSMRNHMSKFSSKTPFSIQHCTIVDNRSTNASSICDK